MSIISTRGLFGLALAVVLAANIAVLAGVAANRRGEPEAKAQLSERELRLPHTLHRENSGLTLQLLWRTLAREANEEGIYYESRSPAWLDAGKLRELGFAVERMLAAERPKEEIPREVLIVLEQDGPAWREELRRAEAAVAAEEARWRAKSDDRLLRERFDEAGKRLKRERVANSRLFAVDAGLDIGQLRGKYGDRSRYLIVRGQIRPMLAVAGGGKRSLHGYIAGLAIESIHVPLGQRRVFDALLQQNKSRRDDLAEPRFQVELAWGRRLEPWIVAVKGL